jgi:hypothetical protein
MIDRVERISRQKHHPEPESHVGRDSTLPRRSSRVIQLDQPMSAPLQQALAATPASPVYDVDLIVIGGGSGGLAAAKEAAKFGAKVTLYVACLFFHVLSILHMNPSFVHPQIRFCQANSNRHQVGFVALSGCILSVFVD